MKTSINNVVKYFIEFLIVLSGVYIAFLLSEMRDHKNEMARRDQIFDALVDEVSLISWEGERTSASVNRMLDRYITNIEQGNFLLPQPIYNPVLFTPHMWNASIQSDGLNLLEVETVKNISLFYNDVQEVVYNINVFRELTLTQILPNLDKGIEEFYDTRKKKLKIQYQWYFDGLERISSDCHMMSVNADSLLALVKK